MSDFNPHDTPLNDPSPSDSDLNSAPSSADAGPLQPAIRVIMMPKDTNAGGTIFGGMILSYIDQAGAVEAYRHISGGRLVTVAMHEVEFHHPVYVGNLVSCYTETLRLGRTSVTVKVRVVVERDAGRERETVTEAVVVYVRVGADSRPEPLKGKDIKI